MNNFCTPETEDNARRMLGNIVWYIRRILNICFIILIAVLIIMLTVVKPGIVFSVIGVCALVTLLYFIYAWHSGDFNLCSSNKNNTFESRWKKTVDGEPHVWVAGDHIEQWIRESLCKPDGEGGWQVDYDAVSGYVWHADSDGKSGRWIPK